MNTLTCLARHDVGALHVLPSKYGGIISQSFPTPFWLLSTTAVGHFLEWERFFRVEKKWGVGSEPGPGNHCRFYLEWFSGGSSFFCGPGTLLADAICHCH